MRKFAIKMSLYLVPLLILMSIMEFTLRSIPNEYKYKKTYLEGNGDKIQTLILGNSHSYYGVNPDYFEEICFNASQVSQPLEYDEEVLRHFENDLRALKTVFINISAFSLFFDFETADESWRNKNYVLHYGMNSSNSYKDYSEVFSMRFSVNLRRLYNYWIKNTTINCSGSGWGNDYTSEKSKNIAKSAIKAANKHNISNYDFFEKNKKHLDSIIQWCKKRNIKLVLYTAPATKEYYQLIHPEQLKTTTDYLKKFAKTSDNCQYINLLKSKEFKAEDYYDADHLNEKGVKKLSKKMAAISKDKNSN
jgi:hypothetical protein